jgi:DNA polymerase-3 subunit delta'
LLKVLEEPPPDVLFLLVAHAPQRLLPTIRSRCRQYALAAPGREVALSWLREQGMAMPATELAHHGGAPLFDHDPALAEVRDGFISALAKPSLASMLTQAERVDKHKLTLAVPLEWMQKWLHDLAAQGLSGEIRYFPDQQDALHALSRRADLMQLFRCQDALLHLVPFGQHPLNVRLQLEGLFMDYLKVFG